MIHPRSSSLIPSRRQQTRWNAFCPTANSTTTLKRTRVVCIMSTMQIVLMGLLLWCSGHHPHTMTITYGVMAFATNRCITPPWSTTKGTVSLLSPALPSPRNMYDTALHQETRRRHATTTTTTSATTNKNQRFKYTTYLVDTLPSLFLQPATSSMGTSTATSAASASRSKKHVVTTPSKKLKFIPMTTTSRLLRTRQKQIQKTVRNMNSDLLQLIDSITNTITTNVPALLFDRICDVLYTCIIPFWYLLPSILCFVPIYTLTVWQTIPVTPDVWKLVNMDFIWWYYTHKPHAISVIFTFLASNASFFMAALFLLKQSYPAVTTVTPKQIQKTSSSTSSSTVSSTAATIAAATAVLNRGKNIPSSLGYWVLAAGIMSTIFHTVQACGNYRIAEALCYLDHGIAGTAICHFYNRCGTPSLRTILCGIIAFITLAFPITAIHLPSYTTLHSLWHTLAAATAVLWAYDATHTPSPKQKPLVE